MVVKSVSGTLFYCSLNLRVFLAAGTKWK